MRITEFLTSPRVPAVGATAAPLGVVACLALAVAGTVIVDRADSRFAILPGIHSFDEYVRPSMSHLNESLVGYLILVVAAVALAFLLRPPSPPANSASPARYDMPADDGDDRIRMTRWVIAGRLLAALVLWGYVVLRLVQKEWAWHLPVFVVLAVVLISSVLLRRDRAHSVDLSLQVSRGEVLALVLSILFAGLLLTFRLEDNPRSIWGDEGAFWESAQAMARGDIPPDPFAPRVYGFPGGSSVYQAAFPKLFGYTMWSWRFSSVFAFLVAMVPTYFLARELYGKRVAFAALALMATAPWAIAFSRLGYNNIHSVLPFVSSLLFLYLGIQRKSFLLFFLAGAAAGIGFYAYFAARTVVFVIGAFMIYTAVTGKMSRRDAATGLALAAAGTIVVGILPVLRIFVENDPASGKKMFEGLLFHDFYLGSIYRELPLETYRSITIYDLRMVFDAELTFRAVLRGFFRTMLAFHRTDLINHHYISGSLGGPWISALFLPGIALVARDVRRSASMLMLIWVVTSLLLLSIFNSFPPQQTHLVPMIPAMAILYAVVLVAIAEKLFSVVPGLSRILVPAAVGVAILGFGTLGVYDYFAHANSRFPPPYDQVVWLQARDLEAGESVVFVHDDPGLGNYLPWGIRWFRLDARYAVLKAEQLSTDDGQKTLRGASVVVLKPDASHELISAVTAALPAWHVQQLEGDGGWLLTPAGSEDPAASSSP
jgi:hypothetical protein